jgi:hypothetical protein
MMYMAKYPVSGDTMLNLRDIHHMPGIDAVRSVIETWPKASRSFSRVAAIT